MTATESCRHLGYWATANCDMTVTKERVLEKTQAALGVLTHHPLEAKTARELFRIVLPRIGIGDGVCVTVYV
jgi:hypothetical protein